MNISGVLKHLESLIAFDTQNPPRTMHAGSPIFAWMTETLGPDFEIELIDQGEGAMDDFAFYLRCDLLRR